MSTDTTWYYALSGEQIGPLSLQDMQGMVKAGVIKAETKVWNGEGEWQAAKLTELASFFARPASNVPPPLSGKDIDNRFIWAVVAVPVVGAVIELLAGMNLFWLYIVANVVCCVLDEKKLKAAGQRSPTNWMVFLVPVYLWKRAELLEQKKRYFWAWLGAFVLSLLITLGGHEAQLEEAACPLVSEIIHKQFYRSATCKAVSIDQEVSDGFYKATAVLDNGRSLDITIEEKGNGQIYVQIPPQ